MSQVKKYAIYCYWGTVSQFTVHYADTIEKAVALVIKKYEKNRNLGGAIITNDRNKTLIDVDAKRLYEGGAEYRKQIIQNCHEKDEEEENA